MERPKAIARGHNASQGAVAKRLCNGLQIRLARFDSGPRLQYTRITEASVVRFFVWTLQHPGWLGLSVCSRRLPFAFGQYPG